MTADTPHPDGLDLIAYVRGALGSEQAEAISQHCVICERCSAELSALTLLRRLGALPARSLRLPRSLVPGVATVQ